MRAVTTASLLAGALALPFLFRAAPAGAAGIRDGFRAAVGLSPELGALEAQRDVVAAQRAQAGALTPGPASIGLSYRTDAITQNRGFREYEGALAVPVWLPGAARAQRGSADAQGDRLAAQILARRLALAGEVRDAYWAWALARAETDAARSRVTSAQALESDLARQVGAGNAARSDLLLAQADARDAVLTLRERETALREAALAFRVLTGQAPTPQGGEAVRRGPAPSQDPRLGVARASAAAGRAALNLARVRNRPDPELAFAVRQERGSFDESYSTRLQVGVRIPFSHPTATRERMAAAQAEIAAAEAEVAQLDRAITLTRARARVRLDAARAIAQAAEARHALLNERASLVQQAFAAGQQPLVELVRARSALADADAARRRATVEIGRAVSQLNQVSGIEP